MTNQIRQKKEPNMTNQIRQGDVLLVRREAPRSSKRIEGAGLRVPGERTGHQHLLPAEVHEIPGGTRLLRLAEPAELRHLEADGRTQADHAPVEVPAGWWEPITQREWSAAAPTPRARFD